MTREEVLDQVKSIVTGERQQQYGSAENNFALISDYWTTYLIGKSTQGRLQRLTAADVANMMTLFKIGRITTGTGTMDSYVDACGYLACGAEIVSHTVRAQEIAAQMAGDDQA